MLPALQTNQMQWKRFLSGGVGFGFPSRDCSPHWWLSAAIIMADWKEFPSSWKSIHEKQHFIARAIHSSSSPYSYLFFNHVPWKEWFIDVHRQCIPHNENKCCSNLGDPLSERDEEILFSPHAFHFVIHWESVWGMKQWSSSKVLAPDMYRHVYGPEKIYPIPFLTRNIHDCVTLLLNIRYCTTCM